MRLALLRRSLIGLALALTSVGAQAQVDVTASAGTPAASYTTLKLAFDAINAGTHQGAIAVGLSGDTTETVTAALNSGSVAPAVYTSVTIAPLGAPRTISGTITGAIIKLNGADNVTIDGRIAGAGRNLTVQNNSTVAASAAIWVASVAAGNGASSNVIRNLEIAAGVTNVNANATFGIIMSGTAISTTSNGVDNDDNQFIFNRIIRARYGLVTRGTTTNLNISPVVADNIIGPAAFGADQIGKVGIFMQADTGALVTRNIVQFVGGTVATTTAGSDRLGIAIGQEAWGTTAASLTSNNYAITKNVVRDVVEERTFSAVGINLATTGGGSATNNLVANNFVFNVRGNSTGGDQTVGIGIQSGHTDRVVFNSVSLTGDVDPGAVAATDNYGSGIRNIGTGGTHANLTLSNNNVYMDLSSSSTAAVRYYAISGTAAAYSFGTGGENNNNLYVNPANPQLQTGGLGTAAGNVLTTQFATLANWQAAYTAPQDAASIQADPQYVSTTADLHIAIGSPSQNTGSAAGGVTDDIDSQVRPGGGLFDIGADEVDGVAPPVNDLRATAFVDPLTGASKPTNIVFAPQASFTNMGTATQTNVQVRYRILDSVAIEVYNQTALIPSIAFNATTTVTFPGLAISAAGTYSIFATAELPSDTVPANDQISGTLIMAAPLAGTYTVGAGGNFASLTNNGGFFQSLNSLGASANVIVDITSDLAGETGTHALNEVAGGFTVRIRPTGSARTVSGSSAAALITLNGADNVTIDGSLTGGTAAAVVGGDPLLRNLTFNNTNTSTASGVILIATGVAGAQNNTLRNLNIVGQAPTTTIVGISVGGATVGSAGADNDNTRIENCSVRRAIFGIYATGANVANPNTGNVITRNDLTGVGAERVRRVGILAFNQNGIEVSLNDVGNIAGDENADAVAIGLGIQNVLNSAVTDGGVTNAQVFRNRVRGVATSTDFSASGLAIAGSATGANTLSNNMVAGVSSPAAAGDLVAGIFVAGVTGSSTRLLNNSVSMSGDRGLPAAAQFPSFGVAISGTNPIVELKNNVFHNTQTAASGGASAESYAIGMASTTFGNLDANFNLYFAAGANAGFFRSGSLDPALGTDYATLALWQAAITDDAASILGDPLFVSGADLHLQSGSPALNVGTPLAAVADDFDGDVRSATTPDIGADELIVSFTVGGSVSGLVGSGLVLQNNLGDDLPIAGDGAFTFTTPVASGATYSVTVLTQPGTPTQTCLVTDGGGTVTNANVTNVAVACTTNTYTVGGSVSGLVGSGLVLQNNLGNDLPIAADGLFTFTTPVASGATYSVTVLTQPGTPTQTCLVTNGSGTIGSANVTDVSVACTNDNIAPTITPVAVTRRAGDLASNSTIANVDDAEDAENTLAVLVNSGATATVNGVTVSGIAVSAAGVVTADVVAACGATTATFTLRVTDAGALFAEATLTVTVDANLAPVLTYTSPQTVVIGQGLTINPATGPSDTGPLNGITLLSQGTYTGGISVHNTTGVVTLTSAAPAGTHTLTIRAQDSCLVNTDAPITLTVTPSADLSIVKQSSLALLSGGMIQYTITATNPGPSAVTGARVQDAFATGLSNVAWTCAGTNSGTCAANGTGDIDQLVNLPVGSTVAFSITAEVPQPLPQTISNTATITAPIAVPDPSTGNNSSTVVDQLFIFRDGFEDIGMQLATTKRLPLARAGITESLALSREAAALAAVGAHPVEFASFELDGSLAVVQARRLGGELEVRLLQLHRNGNWTVGNWDALGTGAINFEWWSAGQAGASQVNTRLRSGL